MGITLAIEGVGGLKKRIPVVDFAVDRFQFSHTDTVTYRFFWIPRVFFLHRLWVVFKICYHYSLQPLELLT